MRATRRMFLAAILAMTFGTGCMMIIASGGYHDDDDYYEDCDRCHYVTVVVDKQMVSDSLLATATAAAEMDAGACTRSEIAVR
jgi:hypothetical protein